MLFFSFHPAHVQHRGTGSSESDAEDAEESKVDLGELSHRDRRVKTARSAVRLREIVRFWFSVFRSFCLLLSLCVPL
jgi:hypothetical protein